LHKNGTYLITLTIPDSCTVRYRLLKEEDNLSNKSFTTSMPIIGQDISSRKGNTDSSTILGDMQAKPCNNNPKIFRKVF
jgi:hypothetical protein